MDMTATFESVCEYLKGTVGKCYFSPVIETVSDGVVGLRFFFDINKSLLIEFVATMQEVIGIEVAYGTRDYYGQEADDLVFFGEPKSLAQILPFVKDYLGGEVRGSSGIYLIPEDSINLKKD